MRYPRRNPVVNVLLCFGYLMRQDFHISRFRADIAPGVKKHQPLSVVSVATYTKADASFRYKKV
jgi:hypothetical protein